MARRKKVDVESVREEVVAAMRSQSPSEREQRVLLLWNRWQEAKAFLKSTRLRLKDEVTRATANLTEAMETGVTVGDDDAAKRKLFSVEVAWQDVQETKAAFKDGVGGARDGVSGALSTLTELIQATQQLDLEFAKREDKLDEEHEKKQERKARSKKAKTEEPEAESEPGSEERDDD